MPSSYSVTFNILALDMKKDIHVETHTTKALHYIEGPFHHNALRQ